MRADYNAAPQPVIPACRLAVDLCAPIASAERSGYSFGVKWYEDWVRRKLPLLLIIVGVVTIFILRWIVRISGVFDIAKINVQGAAEFRAFAVWAIAFSGLVVTVTWASLAAVAIAKQYLSKRGYRTTLILSGGLAVVVGVLSWYWWDNRDLLAIVERARSVPIRAVTLVGNALAVGGATLIVAACIALTTSPGTPSIPELRRRIAESRLLLFSAAALLVVGVVEIYMVFQLPVAVERTIRVAGDLRVLQHVTSSITLIAGLLYTSSLLILFVPVAVVHEKWVDEAWRATPSEKHSDWLESTGLHRSIGSTTSQLIAAAAPLLAALGLTPS
ncbi:MAG TPA: hypothetical protein VEO54_27660 [Thermoanaerobaculia bacterium]|nr:hypothetical protein [Thermoanaerobaculia bacterium]